MHTLSIYSRYIKLKIYKKLKIYSIMGIELIISGLLVASLTNYSNADILCLIFQNIYSK